MTTDFTDSTDVFYPCHPGAQGERVLRFDGEDFDLARHRQAQLAAKGQGLADAQEVRAGPREPAQGGCVQFMDETGAGTAGLNGIHDEGRRLTGHVIEQGQAHLGRFLKLDGRQVRQLGPRCAPASHNGIAEESEKRLNTAMRAKVLK
ncbi:MAG: hypothetical protein ACLQM8_06490 [Limisphaerales bacterium]